MLTRADSIITLRSDKVGKPLPIVEAWKNSTHVMLVYPDCVYARLGVKIGRGDASYYGSTIWGTLHPVRGFWYFYIPKSAFEIGGETAYKIVSTDLEGSRHVCGEGVLRVFAGRIDDTADGAGNSDATSTAYVKFEEVWYSVNVSEDESGNLAFAINTTVDAPSDEDSGTPFAYCRRTGLYHAVSIYRDASGTLALAAEENGVEGDSASFALDRKTGFFYRMEAKTDESGTVSLEVGDRQ